MELRHSDQVTSAARDIAALLAAYEDELMSMEPNAPGVAPLRCAVAEALAKACACATALAAQSPATAMAAPRSWTDWS